MKSANGRYLPAVDHLRLLAALMVVLYHGVYLFGLPPAPWPHPQRWPALFVTEGYSGVTLFMVLSGFVLTYGALGRHLSYGDFLRNRALRILPLLTVLLVFTAVATPAALSPQWFSAVIAPTRSTFGGFMGVTWSVFIEVQLYLLFPVLLRHLEDGGPRRLMSVIALMAGLRFAALSVGANPFNLLYLSVFGRADQFLLGMVAAWALRRYRTRLWALAAPGGLALVVLVLASFNHSGGVDQAQGTALGLRWAALSPTVEGLGWAALVLGYVGLLQDGSGVIGRALARLGATTYSVYLLHVVVLFALLKNHVHLAVGGTPFMRALATVCLIAVPVTLGVAHLSYKLIELPFLRLRKRYVEEPQRHYAGRPELVRVPLGAGWDPTDPARDAARAAG